MIKLKTYIATVVIAITCGLTAAASEPVEAWHIVDSFDPDSAMPLADVEFMLGFDSSQRFDVVGKEFTMAGVLTVRFEKREIEVSGIESATQGKQSASITAARDYVTVAGAVTGSSITISTADGRLMAVATVEGEVTRVKIGMLPKGTYVITVGSAAAKFAKP